MWSNNDNNNNNLIYNVHSVEEILNGGTGSHQADKDCVSKWPAYEVRFIPMFKELL